MKSNQQNQKDRLVSILKHINLFISELCKNFLRKISFCQYKNSETPNFSFLNLFNLQRLSRL